MPITKMDSVEAPRGPARSVAPAPAAPDAPAPPAKPVELELPRAAASLPTSLRFHVDEATGKTVVVVVDASSGAVLRQIPSEEALALARALGQQSGAFIDLKV